MDRILQYRQIDYLRLFKLCRSIDAVKGKRKLPSQCEPNYQKSICKRLLSSLVKELFPDLSGTNDEHHFFITIPKDIGESLNTLSSKPRNYFEQSGDEGQKALVKLNELKASFGGHIALCLPSEIRLDFVSTDRNSKYNQLARTCGTTDHPKESFFQSGKSIMEFKKVWDANVPFLVEFIKTEEERRKVREAEAIKQKKERRQAERMRLEAEKLKLSQKESAKLEDVVSKKIIESAKPVAKENKSEELKVLAEKLEKEKKSKQQQAQEAFNAALLKFIGEKNG